MRLLPRLAVVNITGFALIGGAASQGWVSEIWHGDSSRLSTVIAGLFLVGLYFIVVHKIDNAKWIATALVKLGLVGTVLGFIQALGGVKLDAVGDPAAIAPMVAALVSGMGVALYTTLVGAVLNLWISINVRIVNAHGQG